MKKTIIDNTQIIAILVIAYFPGNVSRIALCKGDQTTF